MIHGSHDLLIYGASCISGPFIEQFSQHKRRAKTRKRRNKNDGCVQGFRNAPLAQLIAFLDDNQQRGRCGFELKLCGNACPINFPHDCRNQLHPPVQDGRSLRHRRKNEAPVAGGARLPASVFKTEFRRTSKTCASVRACAIQTRCNRTAKAVNRAMKPARSIKQRDSTPRPLLHRRGNSTTMFAPACDSPR